MAAHVRFVPVLSQSSTGVPDHLNLFTCSQVSKRPLKHASDTLPPLIRFFDLLLRRMLHCRAVSWATRSKSRYHLSSTRAHWLHTDSGRPRRPSRHAQFYSELVPAMMPVALLGSAVYMVRSSDYIVELGHTGFFFFFSI